MTEARLPTLPPYGLMWVDFQQAAEGAGPPRDWTSHPTGESWEAWFARIVETLKRDVWPVYEAGRGWDGRPEDELIELTAVELPAIREFRALHFTSRVSAATLGDVRHHELWEPEDIAPFEKTLARYSPKLAEHEARLGEIISASQSWKSGEVDLQMKRLFQRPRPYQTAMTVLGWTSLDDYRYQWGKGAVSPSLVSAHCLQASIAGMAVMAALRRHDAGLAADCADAVAQWSMDAADRRVMAGLHYPCDNLASWIVALELVEHVVDDGDVRGMLRSAIERKSLLYRFLAGRMDSTEQADERFKAAFAKPWNRLRSVMRAGASESKAREPRSRGTSVSLS